MQEKPVLLFDGVCNLCQGSVQFIIRHDPKGNILFASLQSEAARSMLIPFQLEDKALKSLIFIEKGKAYTFSTGALRAARHLSGLWPMLYGLIIFPRFIRDAVYRLISKNRYKWFGKKEACWLPTPELRGRFLDA